MFPFPILCFCVGILLQTRRSYSETIPSNGDPGTPCQMGEAVWGTCEDIRACLKDGGVVQREGQIKLCRGQVPTIHVCCRKPHLVAKELCESWSNFWRGTDGHCEVEHPLIIGGVTANVGEFPHTARIGRRYKGITEYNCGGTLISPHYVLTAAHCLFNYQEGVTYWVKLGEHDLEHDASSDLTQRLRGTIPSSLYHANDLTNDLAIDVDTVPVEQVIRVAMQHIYPLYDPFLKYHDVALLRLNSPAKLTKRVLPACLPYEFPESDYTGAKLTVAGWGFTSNAREPSKTLQKVEVPVLHRLLCSRTRANNERTPIGITEDMICAGEDGKDSCSGDSGGPLTIQNPRDGTVCEHTIVGIVSFGIGSVRNPNCGYLGVYGRVSSYLDWITGHIAPNNTTL